MHCVFSDKSKCVITCNKGWSEKVQHLVFDIGDYRDWETIF